jgi:UDP-N-acetylglucosamine pyrophosphorylase
MSLKVFRNFGKNSMISFFHFYCLRIFNTNNLWVNLPAVKRVIEDRTLHMEIIVNNKVIFYLERKTNSYL